MPAFCFRSFNRLKLVFVFFSTMMLLLFPGRTLATHSMGADMTYTCLGNNTYRIRLSFYRDCIGIPASPLVNIDISSLNCGITMSILLFPINGTGQEITPICPSDTSTCDGGFFTGIQEYVYEGNVTFPAQCTDWQLLYEQCCRNAAITTISNPLNEELLVFSRIDNTLTPCNNSPTFSNKPVPFVCLGQTFCFNHGAYDVDGDSLSYQLITPYTYGGLTVNYFPAYSPLQPLTSSPPMTFDYITGDFCVTPQAMEVTVMAVLVSEFRNGVIIGQVERDIQVTVINCSNILPTMTGINGTNIFSASICADAPYCFDVFSNDPDTGQNLTVTWDQAIPAGSLNTVGAPHPNGTFCWTPTQADAGGTPHCFTVTVTDDACPYFGTQVYAYCLTVLNVAVNAGPDQTVSCTGTTTINAIGTTAYGNLTYQWSNGPTTTSQNVGPGTYTVVASNAQCTASDVVQILPTAGVIAAFNAPPVCISSPVSFADMSNIIGVGTITSWEWDFGDGSPHSNMQNPVHQYTTAGNYNVCLITIANSNCPDTICQNVTVNPVPIAAFATTNVCLGNPILPVNNSTPAGIGSFSWDFGNGTSSNLQSPSVTYALDGIYNITLIATDVNGCADTIQQPVTIYQLPVAGFTPSLITPCPGDQFQFTDYSSPNVSAWNWNFGNGQSSILQSPTNTFAPGTYNVLLTTTTIDGCVDTISQSITVNPPFVASVGPPQSTCFGGSVSISAGGGVSYLWSDGQTNDVITVSPSMTTDYIVNVTDASGCLDTAIVTVTIFPLPLVSAGNDTSICTGSTATLNATGGSQYTWNPTGANTQSIIVSPLVNTDYIVTGTDNNGCSLNDTVSVTINPLLVVTPGDPFICPGGIAVLDAGYPGSTYAWSSGQNTQTISVGTGGNYSVTVTAITGCTGIGQSVVTVGGGDLFNNIVNAATCFGHSAILDAGNPGFSYLWSTGETTQSINVSAAGSYSVTVTDTDGCIISFSSSLYLDPLPTPAFSCNPVCLYDSTVFLNNSSVSAGSIVNYHWSFGDGDTSSSAAPTHWYGGNGTFTVTLVATTDSGCVSSTVSEVTVFNVPVAGFQAPPVCLGVVTAFTESSVILNDTLSTWNWNFGDGTSSSVQQASHSYTTFGTYPVQLIVSSIHGCVDTLVVSVTVNPLPLADAGPDTTICSGAPLTVGTASQAGTVYQWSPATNLSLPSSSTTPFSSQNNSLVSQDYNYILTAVNSFGCVSTDNLLVRVKPLPEVIFTSPGPQCLTGNLFTFLPTGQVDASSSLSWNFGLDASPSTSINNFPLPVSYSTAGTRLVTLTYSYGGCPGLPSGDSVTVWAMPLTGFIPSPYEGCAPLTVSLYATNPENMDTYTWLIEGQTIHGYNPVWTFNSAGRFPITLLVMNENGCSAPPVTIPINVYAIPFASFTNNPEVTQIYESLIEFKNKSVGAVQYEWNFGDGATANFFDGEHTYSDTGTFDISLIVISEHGCRDTVYGRVIVEDGFSFYVPNAVTPNDDGVNDNFQGYGTFLHSYEMWIYDRWGKIIYFTDDYNKPWDCRMHSVVQNDTYVYRIQVTDSREKAHVYLGSVTVVK